MANKCLIRQMVNGYSSIACLVLTIFPTCPRSSGYLTYTGTQQYLRAVVFGVNLNIFPVRLLQT